MSADTRTSSDAPDATSPSVDARAHAFVTVDPRPQLARPRLV